MRVIALIGLVLALSACASPKPAHLDQPSSACQQEIEAFITKATGQAVKLELGLFQTSDRLQLEPSTALKLSGRLQGKPIVFTLKRQHQQCWIEGKEQQQRLASCQCKTP